MNRKLKCPKTITGEHLWIDNIWDVLTGETCGSIKYTFPYKYVRCIACEMIDDRKIK